jgi:hypothetical protein
MASQLVTHLAASHQNSALHVTPITHSFSNNPIQRMGLSFPSNQIHPPHNKKTIKNSFTNFCKTFHFHYCYS